MATDHAKENPFSREDRIKQLVDIDKVRMTAPFSVDMFISPVEHRQTTPDGRIGC